MSDDAPEPVPVVVTTSQLLRKIRIAKFDAAAELVEEAAREVGPVTCSKGCSNCCRQKVLLTESEAFGIFLYLRAEGRWTPAEQKRLAIADLDAKLTSHPDWFAARKPCPFLDPHGECSVHPVRPLACLATFSSAGDPERCADADPATHATYTVGGEGPGSKTLTALMSALPNENYRSIAGAVLVVAALGQGLEHPDVAALPVLPPRGADEVIKAFDALGNRIILTGA